MFAQVTRCVPRVSRDDPNPQIRDDSRPKCSPRERGWVLLEIVARYA